MKWIWYCWGRDESISLTLISSLESCSCPVKPEARFQHVNFQTADSSLEKKGMVRQTWGKHPAARLNARIRIYLSVNRISPAESQQWQGLWIRICLFSRIISSSRSVWCNQMYQDERTGQLKYVGTSTSPSKLFHSGPDLDVLCTVFRHDIRRFHYSPAGCSHKWLLKLVYIVDYLWFNFSKSCIPLSGFRHSTPLLQASRRWC